MARTTLISHIERIYVRWVTINFSRRDKPVTRKEYEMATVMANNGYATSVTVDKLDTVKKHTQALLSSSQKSLHLYTLWI